MLAPGGVGLLETGPSHWTPASRRMKMLGEVTQVVFGLLGFPGYLGFLFVAVK